MEEHKIIFLEPVCLMKQNPEGRMWCQDDVWGACECGCGAKAAKYRLDGSDVP